MDCTDAIIERESADSEDITIVGITEIDGWVTIGFVTVVCVGAAIVSATTVEDCVPVVSVVATSGGGSTIECVSSVG